MSRIPPSRASARCGGGRAAERLVDLLCPIAYRHDSMLVARLLADARKAVPHTELWGGLFAYAGEPRLLRTQAGIARDAGRDRAICFA